VGASIISFIELCAFLVIYSVTLVKKAVVRHGDGENN
jgi:hypothetical protein